VGVVNTVSNAPRLPEIWGQMPDYQRQDTAVRMLAAPYLRAAATVGNNLVGHAPSNAGSYVRSDSVATQRTLPKDKYGVLEPDVAVPHTQLGRSTKSHGAEPQAREWMFDSNERLVPTRDIDFTDHGFPSIHPNPHQHTLTPINSTNPIGGGFGRGVALPLQYPWE